MKISNLDLSILKSILTDKRIAIDFATEHDSSLFHHDLWNFTQLVLSYIKTYKANPTYRVLSQQVAKENNETLNQYIKDCWDTVDSYTYDIKDFPHDLECIKKRYAEKQVQIIKEKLDQINLSNFNVDKISNELQKNLNKIKSLNAKKAFESHTLKEAISSFKESYNAKLKNPDFDAGIKTGYSFLDFSTDGLKPGELLLVGAESGGGKSLFLMNLAMQMWMQKNNPVSNKEITSPRSTHYNVLYFSLEMPFKACYNRFLGCISEIPSKQIRNAKLSKENLSVLKDKLDFINDYEGEFEIVDIARGATIETIESIYEETKLRFEPHIVVIDYLGLMELENSQNMEDHLKLGKISEKIHEFARVHKCIVLSAVQLNRIKPSKDAEDRVGLHRVGRSAMIMHNANIGIQIETRPNEKQYPDMIYHIIKCRDGVLGQGRVEKNLPCGRLKDADDDIEFEMYQDQDNKSLDISDQMEGLLF